MQGFWTHCAIGHSGFEKIRNALFFLWTVVMWDCAMISFILYFYLFNPFLGLYIFLSLILQNYNTIWVEYKSYFAAAINKIYFSNFFPLVNMDAHLRAWKYLWAGIKMSIFGSNANLFIRFHCLMWIWCFFYCWNWQISPKLTNAGYPIDLYKLHFDQCYASHIKKVYTRKFVYACSSGHFPRK